jgi:PTS system nitrogen regulatory IIA component
MDLTARDAARLLNVSEDTIHAWIQKRIIPSYRVKDRYRINRVELLEWAAARKMKVSPEIFRGNGTKSPALLLARALRCGGELRDVECTDKASALKAVCRALQLPGGPGGIDRDELYSILIAREALCSTGIGNGIGIPHPRGPIVLGIAEPSVTLAYLRQPIEYGAIDGKPVDKLFVIISTTVHVHLLVLSHLMFALQDAEFRALLDQHVALDPLLAKLEQVEARIDALDRARGETT